ncbi:MAG: flagellar filament capping protein FliD [Myxococcota bacterium]
MTFTFGGLASGLDTNALIDGLLRVEALPLQRNQQEQASLGSARDTLGSFATRVAAVKTAAERLDSEEEFATFSTTTSGPGLVATVTGAAFESSYEVNVDAVARATRTRSDGFSSGTDPLAQSGTLEITVGGSSPVSVSVGSGDTLVDIAAQINTSDARVNASVIFDGTESRLLVQGRDTGAANQVTFVETGSVALGLSNSANTYQNAANARITIDGQFNVERQNNSFADVLPGLTLTVTETTDSPLELRVAPDAEGQAEKLQSFIDAFNTAISAGQLAAGFGGTPASNDNLAGDSAVRTSLDRLTRTVSAPVAGLTGRYNLLASVGVELTRSGTLSLNRSALDRALADDPEAVARVFAGDPDNGVSGVMSQLIGTVEGLAEGNDAVIRVRQNAFSSRITSLEEDELQLERRLDAYESRLRRQFTDLEILISQIQEQGSALSGLTSLPTSNAT